MSIESAELLECFQWTGDPETEVVAAESADVLTYCLLLSDRLGVDPVQIVADKLTVKGRKYPVDVSRGSSQKYDRL